MDYNLWVICQIFILTPSTLYALQSRFVSALHRNSPEREKTINCSCSYIRHNIIDGEISNGGGGNFVGKRAYLLEKCQSTNCLSHLKSNVKTNMVADYMRDVYLLRAKRHDNVSTATKLPIKDITINENTNLELLCNGYKEHINGVVQTELPKVKLRWRKDDKVIRQTELNYNSTVLANHTELGSNKSIIRDTDSRLIISRTNGSLFINNALGSDAGIYACELVLNANVPQIISQRSALHIIETLKFVPQPTSKNLELGSVGKVHCKAQGTPTPHIKWVKDFNESLPITIEDVNGTLIFKSVSFEHRGNFTCIASNDQGEISATVNVNVVVAPQFLVAPEDILELVEFETAVMHCQATGDPKPTIQWDKNLKYFTNNSMDQERFEILENGTLIIHNVQQKDEGIYGCTIGNSAGLKRGEVRLTVKNTDVEDAPNGLITRAVLITMSFAFAYIILVITLMIWCRYRRQARKSRFNEINTANEESGNVKTKSDEYEPCLTDELSDAIKKNQKINDNCNNARNDTQKSDDTACSNQSKMSKTSNAYDLYNLQRSSIRDMILIGSGDFGNVYIGKIKASLIKQFTDSHNIEMDQEGKRNINNVNCYVTTTLMNKMKTQSKTSMDNDIEEIQEEHELNVKEERLDVMVKALNKIHDDIFCSEFKRQIDMFRTVTHKNVVKLLGLCREKEPHYMVLEYSNWGDLKEFLLATAGKVKDNANSSCNPPPFNIGQVLAAAYQIANGMDAIYRGRFVHKDLATRNCIISSDFVVKVTYPALCVDKYCKEYFKYRNSMLPIRWLAPECILDNDYTIKSDVYSFGLVVWELFTQAMHLPLENLSNDEIIKCVQFNQVEHHLANHTPECLKEILKSCWNINPKERPSFSQLCTAFSRAIQSINK